MLRNAKKLMTEDALAPEENFRLGNVTFMRLRVDHPEPTGSSGLANGSDGGYLGSGYHTIDQASSGYLGSGYESREQIGVELERRYSRRTGNKNRGRRFFFA